MIAAISSTRLMLSRMIMIQSIIMLDNGGVYRL